MEITTKMQQIPFSIIHNFNRSKSLSTQQTRNSQNFQHHLPQKKFLFLTSNIFFNYPNSSQITNTFLLFILPQTIKIKIPKKNENKPQIPQFSKKKIKKILPDEKI